MIDPATGWFEIASINTKRADIIANTVEQTWFTRYPWPSQVVLDRGTEFMAEFTHMLENEYGITKKAITKRNPQANSIIERVHQTIGNMIRTFSVQSTDDDDPWNGILSAVAFAVRATVHTTTRATPAQLIFGRDAIFQVQHLADWRYITKRKQDAINTNNARENSKRLPYTYRVGQRVLIKAEQSAKYGTDSYFEPFTVEAVNNNGTVRINEGTVTDTYNIRNVTPYTE
jgi:transposase InsO family protein